MSEYHDLKSKVLVRKRKKRQKQWKKCKIYETVLKGNNVYSLNCILSFYVWVYTDCMQAGIWWRPDRERSFEQEKKKSFFKVKISKLFKIKAPTFWQNFGKTLECSGMLH